MQKVLARAGLGSRRGVEGLVAAGRVSVDGLVAKIGQRVSTASRVMVNGKPLRLAAPTGAPRILLYHKPSGELVTRSDPKGRPIVFDRLPRMPQWIAVGRLDFNTSGLLVLTDSGDLANQLMHPRSEVEREYLVRVLGELTPEQRQLLLRGISLADGPARFEQLNPRGGKGSNRWYQVVIKEGRNREVRRMFEGAGLGVSRLIRVRYGPFSLPRDLWRGRWIELPAAEVSGAVRSLTAGMAGIVNN